MAETNMKKLVLPGSPALVARYMPQLVKELQLTLAPGYNVHRGYVITICRGIGNIAGRPAASGAVGV